MKKFIRIQAALNTQVSNKVGQFYVCGLVLRCIERFTLKKTFFFFYPFHLFGSNYERKILAPRSGGLSLTM
jgi:hypothetical protein